MCFSRDVAGKGRHPSLCLAEARVHPVCWSRVVGGQNAHLGHGGHASVSTLRWEMGSGVSNGRRVASGFQMLVLAAVLQKARKAICRLSAVMR